MKTQSQNWEELVFENRNKSYGAYVIRKSYPKNISEGLLVSILFVAVLLWLPRLNAYLFGSERASQIKIFDPTVITVLPTPTVVPDKKPLMQPKPKVHLNSNQVPLVTSQDVDEQPVLKHPDVVVSGSENGTGEVVPLTGETIGTLVENPIAVQGRATLDYAEVMPTYEGGMSAMMKFIQKKLKYPSRAQRAGSEGIVFVRFVVNSEGKVVDVEVIRGIGVDCDKEAARVIALMPGWKAGMQNKTPVSVRMILPINFRLQ